MAKDTAIVKPASPNRIPTRPHLDRRDAAFAAVPMPASILRLGRALVILLLVGGPLICIPPGQVVFNTLDTPRRLLLLLIAGLLAALILRAWALRGRIVWRRHALDAPVAAFLGGAALSALGGLYPLNSFFGPLWSQDALLLLGVGILLYFGVKEFVREPADIERAITLMVLTGGAVALVGFVDRFYLAHIGHPLNRALSATRLAGTLQNPMFAGTYFAMLIPLGAGAAIAATAPRVRAVLVGSIALMLPALLLTLARGAWLGLLAAGIVVALLAIWRAGGINRPAVRTALTVGAVGCALLLGVALSVPQVRSRLASISLRDATVQTRLLYMRTALRMFAARPIQGWGVGNHRAVFPQFRPPTELYEQGIPMNRGYVTAYPHSLPLQVASEMGLLGLIPFVWLLVILVRSGARLLAGDERRIWLVIGLIGLLTGYLFSNLSAFDNSATMATFWIAVALLAAFTAEERVRRPLTSNGYLVTSMAALAVAAATVVHAGVEFQAANLMLTSVRDSRIAARLVEQYPTRANAQDSILRIRKALGDMREVAALGWPQPDVTPYLFLADANTSRLTLSMQLYGQDSGEAIEARDAVIEAAETGLRLMDREPKLQRMLLMQYANAGRFQDARRVLDKLLTHEPNSSEVHLMSAQLHFQLNEPEEAVTEGTTAVNLDRTYGLAWMLLGHYKSELIKRNDPNTQQLVTEVSEDYRRAQDLGVELDPEYRLEYALSLFSIGENDAGVDEGSQLAGEPEFDKLCTQLQTLYRLGNAPARGQELVHQLRARAAAHQVP